jgi:hypothetical protein
LTEALAGQKQSNISRQRIAISIAAANEKTTALQYQEFEKQVYFDQACFEKISNAQFLQETPYKNGTCP